VIPEMTRLLVSTRLPLSSSLWLRQWWHLLELDGLYSGDGS
jgi:hypothetical protein